MRCLGLAGAVLAMPVIGVATAARASGEATGPDVASFSSFAMIPQRPETPGAGFGVFGELDDTTAGHGLGSVPVQIWATYPNSATEVLVATTTTAQVHDDQYGTGTFQVDVPPAASATYVAKFAGSATVAATASAPVVGTITGQVIATPQNARVKHGHAVRVDIEQIPSQGGTPVILQAFERHHWVTVATARLTGAGHAHFWLKPHKAGRHLYRVLWNGDAAAGPNSSGTIVITAT